MDFTSRTDITNLVLRVLVPVVCCIGAAVATIYIMQEINPLAAACLCASVVLLILAIVSPRAGFFVLLFLCAYLDLVKRMLVFWVDYNFEQVSYVLAAAPVVVIGLFLAVVTRWAFHQLDIGKRDIFLMAVVGGAIVANFLLARRAGAQNLEALKQAANNGLYLMVAPIALKLLETPADILRILRQARLIFIPVAAYGIIQSIFGLADFEIEYLKSGLTIMVKELFDVRPRPFSTLNSAGALGTLCAAFAVLSLYPYFVKRETHVSFSQKCLSLGLFILYLAASFASLVRGAIMVWVAALFGIWCFGSRSRTRVFYWTAVSSFVLLIAFSPYLLEHIAEWDPAANAQSDLVGQALRLQTYAERLKGFVNLTQSTAMYSLFGLPENEKMSDLTYNHDPISSLLVDSGIMGLAFVATGLVTGLRFLHRRLLGMPEGPNRSLALLLLSIDVGWLTSHLLFHAVITTFPVNALFWLFAGAVAFLLLYPPPASDSPPEHSSSDREPAWARIHAPPAPAPVASGRRAY